MNDYLFLFRGGNIQTGKPQSADEMQTHLEKWMNSLFLKKLQIADY